jgi:hypothetical protein
MGINETHCIAKRCSSVAAGLDLNEYVSVIIKILLRMYHDRK